MAATADMAIDSFVLDTGPAGDILKASMKRYRPKATQRHSHDPGYILLFSHGTGFHKEIWEPTIEHLFELDKGNRGRTRLLEAWTIDCQNHGEAAVLNDEILTRKPDILTIHNYAEAFANLCRSGLLGEIEKGVQKVVLVGHSAGTIALLFAATLFGSPKASPFDMMILIEPPIFAPSMVNKMTDMYRLVEKTTAARRSVWESKEAAHEWMKTRIPFKLWDPRILKLHIEYGLRPLPTPLHPDKKGVVLCCSPAHEAAAFTGTPDTLRIVEYLGELCSAIPTHLVFGARNDMFYREVQDSIHDPSVGRVIASVTRVKGAGHLVVQERPDRLADTLYTIMTNVSRVDAARL